MIKNIKALDNWLDEREREEKRKKRQKGNKKKFANKHFKNAHILIKPKTANKNGKEKFRSMMFDGFVPLSHELEKLFNGKEDKIDYEDLIEGFSNKKIMKPFISVCEEYLDSDVMIPEVYGFMIAEFYLSDTEVKESRDFKKLLKVFMKMNEDKIKVLKKDLKKCGLEGKKEIKETALMLTLLSASYPNFKKQRQRIAKFFKELYRAFDNADKIKQKSISSIIVTCFGKKKMPYICSILLQDKRANVNALKTEEEKTVYSMVTTFILDYLKKMDNDDRRTLLKKYGKARENNINVARRVNLYTGLSDDYKKIKKTIDRLIKNGFRRECFE